MRKELDEDLCRKYPKIFVDRFAHMSKTAMCWGFACEDGWYQLLDMLCQTIQYYCDKNPEVPQVVASQVKEKFGGLRFYYIGGDEKLSWLIHYYEKLSYEVCEHCGKDGEMRNRSWIQTLCDRCDKSQERRRKYENWKWITKSKLKRKLNKIKDGINTGISSISKMFK